ncbi:helix-turn-helix domain-containing protein [Holdemania filiformis]|uniref:helix-turn-helix domain-containing protein n=1 Tax=Holdemania filiformis TaxID=61171 RepID=UPI00242CF704|nr:helix-turn-helix transcriptional regulator [Holdemania filiformis]
MNFDRNKLQSALIRKRRKELKWKQESLIHNIPISLSYYSEMERGLRKFPDDIIDELYIKLHLTKFDDIWYDTIYELLLNIKKSIYFCQHDDTEKLFLDLEKQKDEISNSLLFLDYELTVFMINTTYFKKTNLKILNMYLNSLNIEQEYIYTLYLGIMYKNKHRPEEALIQFQKLLDRPYKIRYYSEILYYHTSICLIQKGYLTLAQSYNKEAETLFIKERNLNRLAYTMMHEAIIYTQENHFSEADAIYDRLLITCKGLSSRTMNTILCNAGLNCIKAKDYSKAISIYKQLKPGWQCLNGLHYGIALTLLLSNENKKLNEFLEYSKKYPKNKFIKDMLDIIYLQNKPNQEKAIELKLKSCEKYLTREGSRESMIFVYEQLIQYYETRSIVKQVKYLKKLNELNKRGMQYEQ